jgi:hypothetical protein
MDNNTHIIQITGTNSGLLSSYPKVPYLDAYFFTSFEDGLTVNYPTTTFGGPLTAGIFPSPIPDNWDGGVSFAYSVSGGPIKNYSYSDFSKIVSKINLGNFFCTPTIVLSFSSYDESVSFVKTITYIYEDQRQTIIPQLSTYITKIQNLTSVDLLTKVKLLPPKRTLGYVRPIPTLEYITPKSIFVDVIKADNSVNRLELKFNIIQCGLFDVYNDTSIINTQILNSVDKLLLTLEEKNSKQIYSTIINTNIPFFLLTGGDISLPQADVEVDVVFDIESQVGLTQTTFLAEQIRQQVLELPTIPIPTPEINPVSLKTAEFFYRGERGIRIRPLLTRLLPKQEFYYERPSSGMILTSGGAPYFPGKGILYNLEFRTI